MILQLLNRPDVYIYPACGYCGSPLICQIVQASGWAPSPPVSAYGLSERQQEQLRIYLDYMLDINKSMNLTGWCQGTPCICQFAWRLRLAYRSCVPPHTCTYVISRPVDDTASS